MREGGYTHDPGPLPKSPGRPRPLAGLQHFPPVPSAASPRPPPLGRAGGGDGGAISCCLCLRPWVLLSLLSVGACSFIFVSPSRAAGQRVHVYRLREDMSRDSSAGRASDRRSEGPRFDPGSRHAVGNPKHIHDPPQAREEFSWPPPCQRPWLHNNFAFARSGLAFEVRGA